MAEDVTHARNSRVVYVFVRLRLEGRDYLLFYEHPKWGDWSLVGGHVEAQEERDWVAAAFRETGEEMQPLLPHEDFELEPLPHGPERWGPEISRSAGEVPTVYSARWFALRFARDPAECLAALPTNRFLLVDRERIESGEDTDLTSLVARFTSDTPRGIDAIPYAWEPDRPIAMPRITRRDARGVVRDSHPS
jgi:hypothetical protein